MVSNNKVVAKRQRTNPFCYWKRLNPTEFSLLRLEIVSLTQIWSVFLMHCKAFTPLNAIIEPLWFLPSKNSVGFQKPADLNVKYKIYKQTHKVYFHFNSQNSSELSDDNKFQLAPLCVVHCFTSL